MNFDMAISFG